MCKNGAKVRWKIKEVRCYFDYLICLLSIRRERAGTLVYVSVVQSNPPHFFSFLSFPPLYVGRGKGLGLKDITVCIGEPLPNFFQCFNLVNFKQIVFRVALLKFV